MNKGAKMVLIVILTIFFFVLSLFLALIIVFIALNPGGLATPWRAALGL